MKFLSLHVWKLAVLLEQAGFDEAEETYYFVVNVLVPLAEFYGLNLRQLMHEYANSDEEHDTSDYQLYSALTKIPAKELEFLGPVAPIHSLDDWRKNWAEKFSDTLSLLMKLHEQQS